jgi:hypothetical protein
MEIKRTGVLIIGTNIHTGLYEMWYLSYIKADLETLCSSNKYFMEVTSMDSFFGRSKNLKLT